MSDILAALERLEVDERKHKPKKAKKSTATKFVNPLVQLVSSVYTLGNLIANFRPDQATPTLAPDDLAMSRLSDKSQIHAPRAQAAS
jgi:hypothetical protein